MIREIFFLLEAVTASNFFLVIILIIIYVLAQRITVEQIKKVLDRGEKEFKSKFNDSIEASNCINSILDKLLYDYNGDRVYVFQYHNGGSNISGIPFARCSCTHERCEVGVEAHIQTYQNLPLAMYGFRNDLIAKKEPICVEDIEVLRESDKSAYNLLKVQHIKSLYVVGLYSEDNVAMGFVGLDYTRNKCILTEDKLNALVAMSNIISSCLTKNRCVT